MLKFIFTVACIIACCLVVAQEKISQPELKASYELPAGWTVQQYYKDSWDNPGGSSICHCALAVSIFKVPNGDDFDYLHMVIYPSDKKGASDPMRSHVWQYKITLTEKEDSLHTPNLQWMRYKGRLSSVGENRFKDYVAWKYQTHNEKTWYTIYFWAKPNMLNQYKGAIEKIIGGFKSI